MLLMVFSNCSKRYEYVPDKQFIGTWELKGRSMFEGIQIEITEDYGQYQGNVIRLNDNKYIQMFADVGDTWVSDISRKSKYQFKLTEKQIARELFGLYGLGSATEFNVEFIDINTIGLSSGSSNPTLSTVTYKRLTID